MLVGIYEYKDPNGKYLESLKLYEKILKYNKIKFFRLYPEMLDFWKIIDSLNLFIMQFNIPLHQQIQAQDLLFIIESFHGIKCYPNLKTAWHYDDKIKQYHLLHPFGYPITESWIFYDKKNALQWIEEASFPVIFKLRCGAASQNVLLLKDKKQAIMIVNRMFGRGILPDKFFYYESTRFSHFNIYRELHRICGNIYRRSRGLDTSNHWQINKNYVFFQKFLPNNKWDTRITIIGKRAFAFRRMNRRNDFRASGSGRICYDIRKIDMRCVEIAFQVSKEMDFQSMAFDFLMNEENNPEFCEISYTYLSDAIYNCDGYWDQNLRWHEGHFWPEQLQLIDALKISDLRIPEI